MSTIKIRSGLNNSIRLRPAGPFSTKMTVPRNDEPQPGDAGITILRDYRAGGADDLQAVTTTAQMYALFEDDSGNGQTNPVLATNIDGAGTNAMRMDWTAGGDTDPEQSCYVESQFTGFGGSTSLYVWSKLHLGRTSTGGGNGSVGAYALNTNHSNAHIKKWLIQRANNTYRIYSKIYQTAQDFQIDGNNFNSTEADDSIMSFVGSDVNVCIKYTLPDTIQMWLNGTRVFNRTDCDLNTSNFIACQWMATMLVPSVDMSEYMWDMVIGRDT